MSATISPLAPKKYPKMPAIEGVRFATAEAGIRYKNRTDVLVMALRQGTRSRACSPRSKCPSAPVDWCRENLAGRQARLLVVNSGNANAFTGKKGRETTATDRRGRRPRPPAAAPTRCSSPRPASSASRSMPARFAHLLGRHGERRQAAALERRGQRHHDHRHLPEGGDRARSRSAASTSPSTASPRAPA